MKKTKKIEIKILIQPELALLLAMHINRSIQGSMEIYKIMTDIAVEEFHQVAQIITDQVAACAPEYEGINEQFNSANK